VIQLTSGRNPLGLINVATLTPLGHQARTAQHGQVLRDGGLRDAEARGDIFHRGLTARQTFENRATAGVRERAENVVL